MTLRSIITRTATIALATAALAAPAASARPADMPPAVAKAATAAQHKQAERSADVGDYPTRPAQGEQANPRPDATTTAATRALAERDIAWTTIGIGVAGSLLAFGDRWARQAHAPRRTRTRHRVTKHRAWAAGPQASSPGHARTERRFYPQVKPPEGGCSV